MCSKKTLKEEEAKQNSQKSGTVRDSQGTEVHQNGVEVRPS
jgi:hypothetical protein